MEILNFEEKRNVLATIRRHMMLGLPPNAKLYAEFRAISREEINYIFSVLDYFENPQPQGTKKRSYADVVKGVS